MKQKETEQETIHLYEQGEKQLLVEKERRNMGKIEEGEHIKEEKEIKTDVEAREEIRCQVK